MLNRAITLGFVRCRVFAQKFAFARGLVGKYSFWKSGFLLLAKPWRKMLGFEVWIVTFGESLVENVREHFHFW